MKPCSAGAKVRSFSESGFTTSMPTLNAHHVRALIAHRARNELIEAAIAGEPEVQQFDVGERSATAGHVRSGSTLPYSG